MPPPETWSTQLVMPADASTSKNILFRPFGDLVATLQAGFEPVCHILDELSTQPEELQTDVDSYFDPFGV